MFFAVLNELLQIGNVWSKDAGVEAFYRFQPVFYLLKHNGQVLGSVKTLFYFLNNGEVIVPPECKVCLVDVRIYAHTEPAEVVSFDTGSAVLNDVAHTSQAAENGGVVPLC